jgi:hypothetical protein
LKKQPSSESKSKKAKRGFLSVKVVVINQKLYLIIVTVELGRDIGIDKQHITELKQFGNMLLICI